LKFKKNILATFDMKIISDQRGIRQEVMLLLKRGIEAKSYEGVSPHIFTNIPLQKKNFLTYHIFGIERNYLILLCLLSFYMWLVSAARQALVK